MDRIKKICKNCDDFDSDKNVCTIRFLIHKDKSRTEMNRKPNQRGCEVFMYKIEGE